MTQQNAYNQQSKKLCIALVGKQSMQFMVKALKTSCLNHGISSDIFETGYDSIESSILNPQSYLYQKKPDVCIIMPDTSDIRQGLNPAMTDSEVMACVDKEYDRWRMLWQVLIKNLSNTIILHAAFVVEPLRPYGQIEPTLVFSKKRFVEAINRKLFDNDHYVHCIDLEYLSCVIGKNHWFDHTQKYLSKLPFSLACCKPVAEEIVLKLKSLLQPINKVLVLDLDNTVWGGVIGDVGYEGIELDPSSPIGEAYLDVQRYIKTLYDKGVLLSVCSKNDEAVALTGFKNPNMILKHDMFASIKANWEPKSDNILSIAKALNLSVDSMVFVDDNAFECEQVRHFLPQVTVIELGDNPADYVYQIDQAMAFNWPTLTKDDLKRNETYKVLNEMNHAKTTATSYEAYLEGLHMSLAWTINNPSCVQRFSQLTNKSNQFNLCTRRYSESEIMAFITDRHHACFTFELKDDFTNYGAICCVIVDVKPPYLYVENWVMSCRVLKRDVEKEVMNILIDFAHSNNCTYVVGRYIPSGKNQMVSTLYEQMGFDAIGDEYRCEVKSYTRLMTSIEVM